MDASSYQSEDPFSVATQPEAKDATTQEDDQVPSPGSVCTRPLDQHQELEMNQQTYYTQESDESIRRISTPATRSTAALLAHDAESLMFSEDDPNRTIELSLMQKRAKNEQRNQAFLSRIGLEYGMKPAAQPKAPKRKAAPSPSKITVEVKVEKRGMLLPTYRDVEFSSSGKPLVSDIFREFPFRESEITKLIAHLETGAAQIKNPFVPDPLFVTGSAGVGKTAVIRACVDYIKQSVNGNDQTALVLSSYVDCAALDESSVDELARVVYRQLANNLVESGDYGSDPRGQFISSMMSDQDGKHQ